METAIEIPIDTDLSNGELQIILNKYNCKIVKKVGVYYTIISDDSINFFWLGCNIQNETAMQVIKSMK